MNCLDYEKCTFTRDALEQYFFDLITAKTNITAQHFNEISNNSGEELGLDSLKMHEVVYSLEDDLGVTDAVAYPHLHSSKTTFGQYLQAVTCELIKQNRFDLRDDEAPEDGVDIQNRLLYCVHDTYGPTTPSLQEINDDTSLSSLRGNVPDISNLLFSVSCIFPIDTDNKSPAEFETYGQLRKYVAKEIEETDAYGVEHPGY